MEFAWVKEDFNKQIFKIFFIRIIPIYPDNVNIYCQRAHFTK